MLYCWFKMERKRKNSKTFKIKLLIVFILIAMVAVISIIAINKSIQSKNDLNGVFTYNEKVKYEFNGRTKGAMYDGNDRYTYTYRVEKDKLIIDFKNEAVYDATYTFKLEEDTLMLIGGEGTTGGEYILKKNIEANSDKK